ncbi:hypothetical protein IKQ02_02545 [bacterium]|nr:hypothetical protein [bacterium]
MSYKSKDNVLYELMSSQVDYTKYIFEFLITNKSDKKEIPSLTLYTRFPDEEITSLKEYSTDEINPQERAILRIEFDLLFYGSMDDYNPDSDTFMRSYLNPGIYEFYIGDDSNMELIYRFSYDTKIVFKDN